MTEETQQPDELTLLKARADMLGIEYSNNIGIDTLKKRIAEKVEGTSEEEEVVNEAVEEAPTELVKLSPQEVRQQAYREAMKLVRIRISNNDPSKNELPGEIFTVANSVIGSVKKFIPYDHTSENGYHVPHCIYLMLKRKTYSTLVDKRTDKGVPYKESVIRKAFNIEVLEPLTKAELEKLAAEQRASGRV